VRFLCLSFLCLCSGLCVSAGWAADPATLHVDVGDGKTLRFRLENNYQAPVTEFQAAATSAGSALGCTVTATVKHPEDLHPPATCGFTTRTPAGTVPDVGWKARLVYVEFADGMRWTPKQ
jgi:hypothetical protein